MSILLSRYCRARSLPLAVFITYSALPAAAADAPLHEDATALLNEAIAAIDDDYRRDWAFTETAISSEATTIGRYDPRRPAGERWQLLAIGGRPPTDEEIVAFALDKRDEDDAAGEPRGDDVADMVRPGTLDLIEETGDYWLFSFVPNDDEEEDFLEKMQGTLRIARDGRYLERIHIESDGPFKPAFGVKVDHFLTELTFGPAATGGPIVPQTIEFHVRVRAYLLMNVDESGTVTYSDYEFVGD